MYIVKPLGLWSQTSLASEFQLNRRTVAKRLEGVKPAGFDRGNALYRLADVALILGAQKAGRRYLMAMADPNDSDPEALPPLERRRWYQGELLRMQVEALAGELIPADQVRECLQLAFSKVRHRVLSMPDKLQRECGLQAEALERCFVTTEELLAELHEDLQQDAPETIEQMAKPDMRRAG